MTTRPNLDRLVQAETILRDNERHLVADAVAEAIHDLGEYDRLLNTEQYTLARPASMPDMSGRERFTIISGVRFTTEEQAVAASRRVPALRDAPTLIVRRRAPGEWEMTDD